MTGPEASAPLSRFTAKSRHLFRRVVDFVRNERGTSTLMFGLSTIAIMGAAGASLDYSKVTSARARMQNVIDATALSLARAAPTTDQAAMQTRGEALIRAQFSARTDMSIDTVTITKGTRDIRVVVQARSTAYIASVIGKSVMAWEANTQVQWGGRKIEVALVLDNTGSMSNSGKIGALRTAATSFVNILEAAATEPDSVKIAIVPFNTTVKVGTSNASAPWLSYRLLTASQKTNWTGCVTDRDQSYDVDDTLPVTTNSATLYPAVMCPQTALASFMPLTSDFDALRSKISGLNAAGNTNVTIGVSWGLATLSPDAPSTGGVDFGTKDVDKYMIVLTDGQNTQNRWTSTQTSIDARTELACDAVKAKGIKVYTVRVIDGNATLLRDCATSPGMFYDIDTAAELTPVFQQIANSIAKIRLTQ